MTIVANNSLTISKVSDGVGVTSTVITYANSTSGTTAPSTGWTSSVPTLVKGQYLWTKTVWTYTDTSSKTGYSVSYISKDGTNGTDGTSGIIVSSVAPASPQTGQLWQDTSIIPQLVKKWTGASWVIWEFYAENLKADTLQALSSNIGSIQNDFTLVDGTTGTLHIGNSEYRIDSQILKADYLFKENIFFDPDGLSFDFEGDTTLNRGYGRYRKSGSDFYIQSLQTKASYTVSGIRMSNEFAEYSIEIDDATSKMDFISKNGQGFEFTGPVSIGRLDVSDGISLGSGQITAENVTLVPWQNLILNSGFKAGDGVQPQYRRIKNLDGSYTVQFRGAVSPTSGNFQTSGNVTIGSISGVYTPPVISMAQGGDNTGKGARVAIAVNGNVLILAPNTSSYVYLNELQYIN